MTSLQSLLPTLPDEARVWIYALDRTLRPDEGDALREALAPHLATWTTHGRPVRGQSALVAGRFLLVAGHLEAGDISGCGIDASVHAVEVSTEAVGVGLASSLLVFYRTPDGDVAAVTRPGFRTLVQDGHVTAATAVFDLGVATLGAVRAGAFEKPAGDAWHARAFRLPATTA